MASLTVENYLKAALQISIRDDCEWVSTGKLAAALTVSPGTVTSMLKTLSESGLAEYRPYEGVCLTREGKTLALRMLRRHRLLELFLAHTLKMTWDEVHEEAEHMEHAVSDVLIDRIDEYLDHPCADPHGDPIPAADGEMRGSKTPLAQLSEVSPGTAVRIERVINQGPQFLRFLAESELTIGTPLRVKEHNSEAGILMIEHEQGTISLGLTAAAQILVRAQ